jgi:hypothetical protein
MTGTPVTRDDAAQRKLDLIFRELDAILDPFPSSAWSPEDAQAALDTLSRRMYMHKTQSAELK